MINHMTSHMCHMTSLVCHMTSLSHGWHMTLT